MPFLNTLRPRQDGRHFPDDIFKCIFLNENVLIPIKISLKFVPKGPINNIPALVQIMAWCHSGNKPISEPMMVILPTHICVAPPQWVKRSCSDYIWRQESVKMLLWFSFQVVILTTMYWKFSCPWQFLVVQTYGVVKLSYTQYYMPALSNQ